MIPKNATQSETDKVWNTRNRAIYRILGKIPTIAANAFRHKIGRPFNHPMPNNLDYSANFWFMMDKLNDPNHKVDARLSSIFDRLFIILAEHGSNCSTVIMRHLASSGVDPYTALAGSFASLFGERKCHSVIHMLQKIKNEDEILSFIQSSKTSKQKLPGFGNRVYKVIDPRVPLIKTLVYEAIEIFGTSNTVQIAIKFEEIVSSDDYYLTRKIYANVDYWTAILLHLCQFPPDFFTVVLAIPRVAGFLAHWIECLDDPEYKIFRPRQIYVGHESRDILIEDSLKNSGGIGKQDYIRRDINFEDKLISIDKEIRELKSQVLQSKGFLGRVFEGDKNKLLKERILNLQKQREGLVGRRSSRIECFVDEVEISF